MPDGSFFNTACEIVATRPPLPIRKLKPARHLGEYAADLHIERAGDGYALVVVSHCIDRNGDKDTFTETVSRHASLGDAVAAMQTFGPEAA
jgi:hypothetical protein